MVNIGTKYARSIKRISFPDFPSENNGSGEMDGTYSADKRPLPTPRPIPTIYRSIEPPVIMAKPLAERLEKKDRKSLWKRPVAKDEYDRNIFRTFWWCYTWPIKCLLTVTIPNPKTWRRLYPLTFIMCVIFIGINAYMIVWMLTVTGKRKKNLFPPKLQITLLPPRQDSRLVFPNR